MLHAFVARAHWSLSTVSRCVVSFVDASIATRLKNGVLRREAPLFRPHPFLIYYTLKMSLLS